MTAKSPPRENRNKNPLPTKSEPKGLTDIPPPPGTRGKGKGQGKSRKERMPPPPPDDYYDDDYPPERGSRRHKDQYYENFDQEPAEDQELTTPAEEKPGRPALNSGTAVAYIGFAIIFIGILLPLYHMTFAADIQTNTPKVDIDGRITGNEEILNYSTDGEQKLLLIEGRSGIQVNIPTETGDIEPVIESTFPYGYLYIGLMIITIVVGLLARSPSKRGKRNIVSGILALIPLFFIIILVSQLPSFIGEEKLEPPLDSFVEMVSSGPMGGALPLEIDYEYESEVTPPGTSSGGQTFTVTSKAKYHTSIVWGLGTGGFLLILGSIFLIAGGAVDIHLSRLTDMRISAYREAMLRAYQDYNISPDEANIMIGLRKNLKITDKQHRKVSDEIFGKQNE